MDITKLQSDSVTAIFPAMVKAIAALNNPARNKKGHGYKYTDLAEAIDVSREILAENDLAVTQLTHYDPAGQQMVLVTRLIHASGEWVQGTYQLERAGMRQANDAQQIGAAITYARRYSLLALLNMAQDDDDAASVGKGGQTQNYGQRSQANGASSTERTPDGDLARFVRFVEGKPNKEQLENAFSQLAARYAGQENVIIKLESVYRAALHDL